MSNRFPNEFYRGVSTKDQITSQGYAMAAAFQFPQYDGAFRGDDGYCEVSINWNDSDNALNVLLNQRKEGTDEVQFKIGYLKLSRMILHNVMKCYMDDSIFAYERRPVQPTESNGFYDNPYHGNLLLKNNVDKNIRKNIQHTLATIAGRITSREELK